MKGLAPHTERIFEPVSKLACIKPFTLVGGTALAGNIVLADVPSIGAMKMEVMLRRATFRDYYDIYAIMQAGIDINDMIPLALEYSRHRLKTKNLLAMLTNGSRFNRDARFEQLSPTYDVTSADIEAYIKKSLSFLYKATKNYLS